MKQRYQLSPFFRLSSKRKKETILHRIDSKEGYQINATIHEFLSFFAKKPITFLQGVALFAKKHDETIDAVQATVDSFFGDMFHQSIVIEEEEYQHLQAFPIQKEAQEKALLQTYNVKKKLSKEYYLSIYLVENIETQTLSILKILHLNAFFSPKDKKTFRTAFLQEIHILQKIKAHHGIVEILQHTDNKDVMTSEVEFVNGTGLRQFILKNNDITFDSRQKIYQNVIAAYSHLHRLDVLHGDIHASNILVQEDFSIKLIDFDMAYHNTPIRGEIISRGGVQSYIAPEKIGKNAFEIASKRADFCSEVYQIGIIGYILFMNKLPFEADSWNLLANKIKKENPVFDNEKLPIKLVSFLQRAMSKKTKERFASAAEMLEEWNELSLK